VFRCKSVHVTLYFQRPIAAKQYIGGEHVLKAQERYGLPLSTCQVLWGSDIARRQGRKSSTFFVCLSVTLLNDKVCKRHFAINALEFGNDLGIVG